MSLHVGCGRWSGTKTWQSDNWTPGYTVLAAPDARTLALNAFDCGKGVKVVSRKTVRGSCRFASRTAGSATDPTRNFKG